MKWFKDLYRIIKFKLLNWELKIRLKIDPMAKQGMKELKEKIGSKVRKELVEENIVKQEWDITISAWRITPLKNYTWKDVHKEQDRLFFKYLRQEYLENYKKRKV